MRNRNNSFNQIQFNLMSLAFSFRGICRNCASILFLIYLGFLPLSGQKFTISGYIEEATTGERLISANIYDPGFQRQAILNSSFQYLNADS